MNEILKIYRVKDWVHYAGYILFGSLISGNINYTNFLIAFFMLAYAFSLNDYYDKKKKDKLFVLPLLFSFIFLPFLNYIQLFFYFSFIVIFTLYSLPSTYLEGRPLFSILTNSIGFLFIFLLPFTNIEKILKFLDFSLLLFLLNVTAQIIHEIEHYKDDRKVRKITTAISLGIKTSTLLLRLVLITTFLFSLSLFSRFNFISISTLLFSCYFFFLSYGKINEKFRKKFKIYGIVCGVLYVLDLLRLTS